MLSRFFRSGVRADAPAPHPAVPQVDVPAARPAPGPQPPARRLPTPAADKALLDALTESRQRFKDIVEVSGDFAWETDADGAFVFVSPGVTIGYRSEDMVGKPARKFILAEDGERSVSRETPFSTRDAVRDDDVWLRTVDGKAACLQISAVPVRAKDGTWQGARGICRDVTEDRRQHAAFVSLQVREALMARIVKTARSELAPEAMLTTALYETRNAMTATYVDLRRPDGNGGFEIVVSDTAGEGEPDASDATVPHATVSRADVSRSNVSPSNPGKSDISKSPAPLLTTILARMQESGSMVTAADAGHFYLCAPTLFRDVVTGAVLFKRPLDADAWTEDERAFSEELAGQFAIMLEQIDNHRKLEALARNDELTGLLNRRAFQTDLADRLARIEGGGSGGAMFYVDFDNFKLVNDVHGHKRGDEALVALSDLLRVNTRAGDLVARFGGDEFALWLERTDTASAETRAQALIEESQGLRIFSGAPDRPLGISVGVAVVDAGSTETFAEIAARADSAMYQIKRNGKAGYVVAAGPVTAADGATAAAEGPEQPEYISQQGRTAGNTAR